MEAREFFDDIGWSLQNKCDVEVKEQIPLWIANKDNQDKFLAKLSEQMREGDGSVSQEVGEMLESLKDSLRLWSATLEKDERVLINKNSCALNIRHLAFTCSRKKCHHCEEHNSIEEEIEAMKEEVDELKNEARDIVIRAVGEAMGAGASMAALQVELAIIPGYFASKDIVESCRIYNEAVELEHRVEDLEQMLREERGISEGDVSTKRWWEFWK